MDIRAVTSHAFVQDNACKLLENVVKNVYNVSGKEPALLNFTEPLLKHSTLVTEQCSSPYKITEEQIDFFFHGCRVCPGEKTPPCSRMHVPPRAGSRCIIPSPLGPTGPFTDFYFSDLTVGMGCSPLRKRKLLKQHFRICQHN